MPGTAHGLSFDHAALAAFWSTMNHMWSYCSHLCNVWFCIDSGAQELKWKAAGCSPWCSPAFEVLVVVVCRSQPRGYDWHRFYVSSLFFSVKVGLCASCDGIVSCLMLFVFEARHVFFVHNCDILWEVQGSRALFTADRLHSSAKPQSKTHRHSVRILFEILSDMYSDILTISNRHFIC